MISSKKLPKNDDSKAFDSILQIGHCFVRNGVPQTKIDRRLTVLCKLVIFLVVTGFTEIFIVTAPHWRCDDKQEKQTKNDYYEVSNSSLQIGYLLGSKKVQREFHRKSSKMWLWWKAPKN